VRDAGILLCEQQVAVFIFVGVQAEGLWH